MRGVEEGDVGESGNEIGTRCTQVHVPAVEDCDVLLEITIFIGLHPPEAGGEIV
jgi:hypothetical protein